MFPVDDVRIERSLLGEKAGHSLLNPALTAGGEELDMVVNVSRVLSLDWDYVRDDIRAVIDAVHHRLYG